MQFTEADHYCFCDILDLAMPTEPEDLSFNQLKVT